MLGLKRSCDFLLIHGKTFSGSSELPYKSSDDPEATMMKKLSKSLAESILSAIPAKAIGVEATK